ncbi:MAG: flagellar basal body P-ring protein FlgI [Planctomycetota bacterium]
MQRPELPPRDIPASLRGTIGSQVRFNGVDETLVSGLGFVVGLNGTGGGILSESVAATMEREMAIQGVGQAGAFDGTILEGKTPRELLNDRNTAVVIVEAAIPPGAPEGSSFDVYVRALNATSLEGGRLWTTELRFGRANTFGGDQRARVAEARGEVFVNPFAEPGKELAGVTRNVGRVLDGGVVLDPLEIDIRLDNPSHARARLITAAINGRFPRKSGEAAPARGRNDEAVALTIPRDYTDRPGEFIELVKHVPIDQSLPQAYARRYSETLISEPYLGNEMAWALQALGEPALPFLRDLYDHGDQVPRLAALRAGAQLGDPRAAPHLLDIGRTGEPNMRPDAIALLGRVDGGPTVDEALKQLLAENELTVRIAAYEALAERAERAQARRLAIEAQYTSPTDPLRLDPSRIDAIAKMVLPAGSLQGVGRLPIAGKFVLDRIPYGEPLIYVTQQGTPRIALFGEKLELEKPMFVSAWSDRFMMASDSDSDPIRLFYREPEPPDLPSTARSARVSIETAPRSLPALIDFLAHSPTPEDPQPGLGMTYTEIVGILYEIQRAGAIMAAFSTERDRLLAELLSADDDARIRIRPEGPDDEVRDVLVAPEPGDVPTNEASPTDESRPSLVVPLPGPGGAP